MSSNAKHTPGPWFIGEGTDYIAAKDGSIVAELPINANRHGDIHDQDIANASLIAASPNLLAACEVVLGWADEAYKNQIPPGFNSVFNACWAACSLAKGGTK